MNLRLMTRIPVLALAVLSGCAGLQPENANAPLAPAALGATPSTWQTSLPHGGAAANLTRWWQHFNDPLLTQLVAEAQAQNASVATAASRIAQARATRVAAGAALLPQVDGSASASRGRQDVSLPAGTSLSAGVQASWEIDLFGGQAAARTAAQARLEGAQAGWHEARVAVASEVANSYIALRACEAQAAQTERDAGSRAETARLAGLSAKAGFQAPADAALSRASAAQARATLAAQRANCSIEVKALVALTGLPEPGLRQQLGATSAQVPQPGAVGLGDAAAVPARALAQRPDLQAAERELVAASADVGQAQAQRLPRITLSGNLGAARLSSGGFSNDGTVWALGPLQVSLPVFDGGTRRANVVAARARYDEAAASYRSRLRNAVREVEEALVRVASTAERAPDAQAAADGFNAAFRAAEARYKGGLGSLFELEDARRSAVQAEAVLIDLQRERSTAWVQLYRALGGGWSGDDQQLVGGWSADDRQLLGGWSAQDQQVVGTRCAENPMASATPWTPHP